MKIQIEIRGKNKHINEMGTNSLWKIYNFKTEEVKNCIIKLVDICRFYNKEFYKIKDKQVIEKILYIAETCKTISGGYKNFYISNDGTIKISDMMKDIKDNIDLYKKAWKNFKKENEQYNKNNKEDLSNIIEGI